MKLFESIKPLFTNKPLIVVLNKVDIVKPEDLDSDRQNVLKRLQEVAPEVPVMQMSTLAEEGVIEVKNEACERLLSYRVENKVRSKKVDTILNRLHVAMPKERDAKERPPCIPESVQVKKIIAAEKRKRKLEKDLEEELQEDYTLDLKKNYAEIDEEERYDNIPEFWDGHNIADYIDPDIFEKLEELEREEGLRMEAGFYEPPQLNLDATLKEIRELAKQIRYKKFLLRDARRLDGKKKRPTIPRNKQPKIRERSVAGLRNQMESLGVDMSGTEDANFTKSVVSLKRHSALTASGERRKGKLDKEQSAICKATGKPLKRAPPRNELGVRDKIVSRDFLAFHIPFFQQFFF